MEGWIKLYRKILENPIITKDSDYLAVWIYLLLNATHKECDVIFKGKRTTLKKGQLLTGRKSISANLKINEYKVQRILKTLENEHQIEQQSSNQNRLITIVSWDKYQEDAQQNAQQVHNECTTSAQQMHTNKNVKNDKNVKNEKKIITVVSDSCVDGLQEVIDFYNENVGILTPYGLTLIEDYLKEIPSDVIIYAMQISVEADKRNIKYIKAILNTWISKGIKSLVEAQKESQKFKNKKTEETEDEKRKRKIKELEELMNGD